ncbi:MAG: hypothetical protein B6241_00160 [Spirochaetaceae bacterium 4572_59]|nr:MAG: hypothetical protein B6241_00160 [Spirochaetaceae bacterium 4572_59]
MLVIPVMIGLILVFFYKGRYWCGNICAHGSLWDSLRKCLISISDDFNRIRLDQQIDPDLYNGSGSICWSARFCHIFLSSESVLFLSQVKHTIPVFGRFLFAEFYTAFHVYLRCWIIFNMGSCTFKEINCLGPLSVFK